MARLPCRPNNGAEVDGVPRVDGEVGLLAGASDPIRSVTPSISAGHIVITRNPSARSISGQDLKRGVQAKMGARCHLVVRSKYEPHGARASAPGVPNALPCVLILPRAEGRTNDTWRGTRAVVVEIKCASVAC
jgi:hypothetical protein